MNNNVGRQLAPVPHRFRYIKFVASSLSYKEKRFINTALYYNENNNNINNTDIQYMI